MRWIAGIALLGVVTMVAAAGCENDGTRAGADKGNADSRQSEVAIAERGTAQVGGRVAFEIEAGDFFFTPTYLRGTAGQQIALGVVNTSDGTRHNFTITDQGINQDIAPGEAAQINVTFPESGALIFLCKFHVSQGMQGQLLVADASPRPVPR
jgi:plastocyanin